MKKTILLILLSFVSLIGKADLRYDEILSNADRSPKVILAGELEEVFTRSISNNFIVVYQLEAELRVVSNNDIGIIQVKIYNNYSGIVYSSSFNTSELMEFYIDLSPYHNGRYYIQISNSSGSSLYGYFMLEDAL